MPPATIDSSTKVQVGILMTLLGGLFGAAWWASAMTSSVDAVRNNSDKMTDSMLRLEGLVSGHELKIALSDEQIRAINKRLDVMESKVLK